MVLRLYNQLTLHYHSLKYWNSFFDRIMSGNDTPPPKKSKHFKQTTLSFVKKEDDDADHQQQKQQQQQQELQQLHAGATVVEVVVPANDIGHAVGRLLSSEERASFLEPWKPTVDSDFPSSLHVKSKVERRRRLLPTHLATFPWLSVSKLSGLQGAYCTPCVLFGSSSGVGGQSQGFGQLPGKLVSKPLARFDDLTGKEGALTSHQTCLYHQDSVIAMENFRQVFVLKTKDDIMSDLNTARKEAIEDNRRRLVPMVDTILLCGRQNISLRGHRGETGLISADGLEPDVNDGNFRALLRYRIRAGDTALKAHIDSAKGNATYQSAEIQNELINAAGSLVRETVLARIKKASFWALIADETTDRAKREQMAVVIRYVLPDEFDHWHCYEDTVAILDVFADMKSNNDTDSSVEEMRLSGVSISETLLRVVGKCGLPLETCVAQGYDGASSMSSERVGAAANFKLLATNAHYFHCATHRLNLSAASTVQVPAIKHALDIVQETSSFFHSSAKRTELLIDCIEKTDDTRISKKHLKTLCTTRFIERHTAIVCMRSLLRFVDEALTVIKTTWQSADARKSATVLQNSICQSDFVISIVILEEVCALMLPLTRVLQTAGLDLVQAMSGVDDLLASLQKLRSNEVFTKLFTDSTNLAELLGVQITKPRTASRSVYRPAAGDNSDNVEAYYRINFFFPTIDNVVSDIQLRFGTSQQQAAQLSCTIPYFMKYESDDGDEWRKLEKGAEVYSDFLSDPTSIVKAEFELWRRRWEGVPASDRPASAVSALDHAKPFPNISSLLKLLATVPVSTAEAERCFSKLERTLTCIRATMGEQRLESLMMLAIHRTDTPSVDEVINRFAASAARRLNFIL